MRLKMFRISPEALMQLIRGDFIGAEVEPEFPSDTRIVEITRHYDVRNLYNYFDVIIESESFPDLPEGGAIPWLKILYVTKPKVLE